MYAERMAAEATARGDHEAVKYWLHIKAIVDEAPPLAPETRAKLRILLRPAPVAEPTAPSLKKAA